MRQAEREVARYLADTGGKFTDEAEREIERRFLSNQYALVESQRTFTSLKTRHLLRLLRSTKKMATLPLRASHIPEAWALPRFARVGSFFSAVLDVFAEAHAMAVAIEKAPFITER